MRLRSRLARITRIAIALSASVPCAACLASPTTFVLTQAQRRASFDAYIVRFAPHADDPAFDSDLKEAFDLGLLGGLSELEGMHALVEQEPTERTLILEYRAAGLSLGSLAERAGTAAVNAFLPVGVVPEMGGGDLGVESTFLGADGVVIGRVLVQCNVKGLLNTDDGVMRTIGARTAEFVGSRFSASASSRPAGAPNEASSERNIINLSPERARQELSIFDPMIGEWDLAYEVRVTGAPVVRAHVHEICRWEASGRVFIQCAETQDVPERLFRCNAIVYDPIGRGLKVFAMDSVFGAHYSQETTFERSGNVLKAVANEKDRVTEVTETISDDGSVRHGTKLVWTPDRSRLLLEIHSEGTRHH